MTKFKEEDLKQKVEFYNPHPGLLGAVLPLSKPMVNAAASLDGQVMTLEQAMERITPVAEDVGGSLEIVENYGYIGFFYREESGREHFYRLIRYKEFLD